MEAEAAGVHHISPRGPAVAVAFLALAACKAKSDQDLINRILDDTIAAADDKKAGGVVEHAAEDFTGPGNADKQECRRILTGYFLREGWIKVFEQDRTIEVKGETASVKLDVIVAAGNPVETLEDLLPTNGTRMLFTVEMKKAAGEWTYAAATYQHVRP